MKELLITSVSKRTRMWKFRRLISLMQTHFYVQVTTKNTFKPRIPLREEGVEDQVQMCHPLRLPFVCSFMEAVQLLEWAHENGPARGGKPGVPSACCIPITLCHLFNIKT